MTESLYIVIIVSTMVVLDTIGAGMALLGLALMKRHIRMYGGIRSLYLR